jgi:hypothetical protein
MGVANQQGTNMIDNIVSALIHVRPGTDGAKARWISDLTKIDPDRARRLVDGFVHDLTVREAELIIRALAPEPEEISAALDNLGRVMDSTKFRNAAARFAKFSIAAIAAHTLVERSEDDNEEN